jgi:hypothetical protein
MVAGIIVYLPAIRSPYFLDDYVQAAMAGGTFPLRRSPFDLYAFIDPADRPVLLARGMLPWWADPRLSIRFFRPLSSALISAEHRLLGDGPLLLHLHSLLWWAAVVIGAAALFRRVLPARPARLATVIFALAPCHVFPLGWLANREVLVSMAFGLPALSAYLRHREQRSLRDAALATLLFALSLAGGEYALCFAGYVLAFELVGLRDGDRSVTGALAGALPFAVPAAAYLAARAALGYGTRGSGFYADPFGEPALFFGELPRRFVSLVLDGWFSLDHETITALTPPWALAIAFGAAAALLGPPLAGLGLDAAPRRTAGWMLLGSLLSLAPVTAVIASPRVLGVGMVGIAANVAWLLEQVWFAAPPGDGPRPRAVEHARAAALALGFAHLVHGPVTSFLVARGFREAAASFADHVADLRARLVRSGSSAEQREVMVVRGMAASLFLPWLDRRDPPPPWRILAQTGHVLSLRRGPRSLELVIPPAEGAFSQGSGNLFRSASSPMAAGDVFSMPGLRVTVLDVGPSGPRRVRYDLDRDLDSPSLLWITEDRTGFPRAEIPAPGFGQPFDP